MDNKEVKFTNFNKNYLFQDNKMAGCEWVCTIGDTCKGKLTGT